MKNTIAFLNDCIQSKVRKTTKLRKWVTGRLTAQLFSLVLSIYGIMKLSREGGRVWLAIVIIAALQIGMIVELLHDVHVVQKERKQK